MSSVLQKLTYDVRFVFTPCDHSKESFAFLMRGFKTVSAVEKTRINLQECNSNYVVGFEIFPVYG